MDISGRPTDNVWQFRFCQQRGRHVVEGLEKRRRIMPGSKVLATRGAPRAGMFGKKSAESGPGVRFWQHEGRQVLECLEKRRRIRPGSKVLATRGSSRLDCLHFFRTLCAHLPGENASQERCCCSPAAQQHSLRVKPSLRGFGKF